MRLVPRRLGACLAVLMLGLLSPGIAHAANEESAPAEDAGVRVSALRGDSSQSCRHGDRGRLLRFDRVASHPTAADARAHPGAGLLPAPKVLAQRVGSFAGLLTGRRGDRLDAWIDQVGRDDLLHLCSFAVGLARDYDAVVNGLTLTWSSGPVEGNVNRIKMLNARCTAARSSTCSAPGSSTHDR